ncbi:hypothetical protein [Micromonospora sp. HNM0581]|uniref:hypothetical protein n=1 Tax=Micromonospora sp. HNM0581 TaxID=2716341 RepID=UPI001F0F407E|nr:hypothetical protein [Micromonospora sp. HNM0581]
MGVGDVDVAVGDVPEVGGVVQDPVDGVSGPLLAGPVGDTAGVEVGGDGAGAESVAGVEAEDVPQDGCLVGVGDEALGVRVDEVAVGAGAAGPLAFAGFRGHATFHSVDDHVAFVFGEDGEELQHHAADCAAGVDGFGGGGDSDVGGVEGGGEVDEVGEAAAESVDSVDE